MKNVEPGAERLAHAQLAAEPTDARGAADAAVAAWRRVEAELAPIIGARGFAALLRRSLQLTGRAHPCLGRICDASAEHGDYAALHGALSAESEAAGTAAQAALRATFGGLLARLIGTSLSERLMGAPSHARLALVANVPPCSMPTTRPIPEGRIAR